MPVTLTIDHTNVITLTVSPTSATPEAYRFNVKYGLEDITNAKLYQKEMTYYSDVSGYAPALPPSFQTLVTNFLAGVEAELNTLEGL